MRGHVWANSVSAVRHWLQLWSQCTSRMQHAARIHNIKWLTSIRIRYILFCQFKLYVYAMRALSLYIYISFAGDARHMHLMHSHCQSVLHWPMKRQNYGGKKSTRELNDRHSDGREQTMNATFAAVHSTHLSIYNGRYLSDRPKTASDVKCADTWYALQDEIYVVWIYIMILRYPIIDGEKNESDPFTALYFCSKSIKVVFNSMKRNPFSHLTNVRPFL